MDLIEQKFLADVLMAACGVMCLFGAVIDQRRNNLFGRKWDLRIGISFVALGFISFIFNLVRYK